MWRPPGTQMWFADPDRVIGVFVRPSDESVNRFQGGQGTTHGNRKPEAHHESPPNWSVFSSFLSMPRISALVTEPNLRWIIVPLIVRRIPVTTDGNNSPASFQDTRRWSPKRSRWILLLTAATISSCRLEWYAAELSTTAGRCFQPDSSANMNPTKTISPRLQLIVGCILHVIP